MCGIMGYIGKEDAAKIIINGLEELEYRGYDSAGIAVNNGKKINIEKVLGSPSNLRKSIDKLYGYMGIGHTRWATHGAPTCDNAHPHISRNGKFIVVHNGIIENYNELKTELINDGFEFKSETDTEVIAQLLEKHYFGDLKGAVKSVLPLLKGSYALGIMCSDYDDVLVCAKKSSPLFIGTTDNCGYIASDISALDDKSKRIFRLNDGEIGFLKNSDLKVYDIDGCRIKKSEVKIKKTEKLNGRAGYEHFMLKEIFEQPDAVKNTLNEIINNDSIIFKDFKYNSDEIKRINNIRFVACGSAYHAGKVGAYVTERLLNINSEACIASEFRYSKPHLDENCLVVIISQSGETADTLAALRMAKEMTAKAISIVNVENSTIAQESDAVIFTRAGKEVSVATTKAYSSQLAVIYSLALFLAKETNKISDEDYIQYLYELKSMPEKIQIILNSSDYINKLTNKVLASKYVCFIGRSFDYCSAMEGALKLKEVSYIPCESYAAGELKHGTISLISNDSLIIGIKCCNEIKSKTMNNIDECKARGAEILLISTENGDITVPQTNDIFYPLLEAVPLQLLAYYTAKKKGCEIDKPRNLAKSVTVE